MNQELMEQVKNTLADFTLPSYYEIPDVGLYLEQTSRYIMDYLEPLGDVALTGSMISNYVKKKILINPKKKLYNREQIACLFFIAITKSVLSLENIQLLLTMQKELSPCDRAYEYFRKEFCNALQQVCKLTSSDTLSPMQKVNPELPEEAQLLSGACLTAANKIYLDKYLSLL